MSEPLIQNISLSLSLVPQVKIPNGISDSSIEFYIIVNSRTSIGNQPFRIFLTIKLVNTMEFNATFHQLSDHKKEVTVQSRDPAVR